MGLTQPSLDFDVSSLVNPLEDWVVNQRPIIDVRAPIEFYEGHIPGSINLPILNDQERHEIGICYKNLGSEAAIRRGFELVSGENKKQKIQAWVSFLEKNPQSIVTCFRGGQRSQISQVWMSEAGFSILRVNGGYKKARQFFIQALVRFCQEQKSLVISGKTGSNKTKIIEFFAEQNQAIDLEKIACHRGSAFGEMGVTQPTQAQFENNLAVQALKLLKTSRKEFGNEFLIEDESRMIGKITQPEVLFGFLRSSPIVLIEDSLDIRTHNIFESYILRSKIGHFLQLPSAQRGDDDEAAARQTFHNFQKSVQSISRKLGGEKTAFVQRLLQDSEDEFFRSESLDLNRIWISELLNFYYDPLYEKSLEKRQPEILFKGNYLEVLSWLENRMTRLNEVSAKDK